MRYTGKKLRRLATNGEVAKIVRQFSALRRRFAEKNRLLLQQAEIAANLRQAYMETELDRDRLNRICQDLYELCCVKGFAVEAEQTARRYGGLQGFGHGNVIG